MQDHDPDPDPDGKHRDVSPERFSKLEKELVRGKAEMVSLALHLS
jgi:Ase1/PRC1/MAP65 family protein